MGFMQLIGKPKRKKYTFDEDDREISLELRRARAELREKEFEVQKRMLDLDMRRIERELQELESDTPAMTPEVMLMSILAPTLSGRGLISGPLPQTSTGTPNAATGKNLSDDEIRALIAQFDKKQQKFAAKMPEEVLMQHALRMFPGYDADTYERAIRILKE